MVPPRQIEKTGDNSPARSLFGFVWRMSGWHQILLALVAILVAVLTLAPIEIQRRMIDDAIADKDLDQLFILGWIYLAIALVHQFIKFILHSYQGWLGESTIIYTRRHLLSLAEERHEASNDTPKGTTISVITTELDQIGGYVGETISTAAANLSMLIGGVVYMLIVAPGVAVIGLAFLIPQILLTPFVQKWINALVEERVNLMRKLSAEIGEAQFANAQKKRTRDIFRNRIKINVIKSALKAGLNALNRIAPLSVLVFGGAMVIEGNLNVGVIVAFISGFERMAGPARDLITFYRQSQQAGVQHEQVAKWMAEA